MKLIKNLQHVKWHKSALIVVNLLMVNFTKVIGLICKGRLGSLYHKGLCHFCNLNFFLPQKRANSNAS